MILQIEGNVLLQRTLCIIVLIVLVSSLPASIIHPISINADNDYSQSSETLQESSETYNQPNFTSIDKILTTDARHLDSNRNFVEDIYYQTANRDGFWTGEIPVGHYVRVTFEQELDNTNDITVFAKSRYENGSIEVYEKDSDVILAQFGTISEDGRYRVLLTTLIAPQNTFDLRIVGGPVEFDQIIDPAELGNSGSTNSGAVTSSPVDLVHTVGGDKRLLLVGVSIKGNATVSSASWGSSCVADTQSLSRVQAVTGAAIRTEVWGLVAPVERSDGHVCVVLDGAFTQAVVGATDFTGVDQENPIPNTNSISGQGPPVDASVSSSSGNLIFSVITFDDVSSFTDSQTNEWKITHSIGNDKLAAAGSTTNASAEVTSVSYTPLGSTNNWALSVVEVKSDVGETGTSDTTAPVTSASPEGGTYDSTQHVTLLANEEATIYYTTDGSLPDTSSAVYDGPIEISSIMTLKFFAVDIAGNQEEVKTEAYTITGNFIFSLSPTVLPAIAQGDTSTELTVSVTSPPDKTVPNTRISLQGLGTGMTAEWKKNNDESFTSFSTPLELQPGLGETETASIIIHTSTATQPTTYALQVTAIGLDDSRQTETRSVQLRVDPQSQQGQAISALVASPSSAGAGATISLTGTGFTPDSIIPQITFGPDGQNNPLSIKPDDTITVTSSGQWSIDLSIPSDAQPGIYAIRVTSSDSKSARTTFEVLPQGASFGVSLSTDVINVQAGNVQGTSLLMGITSVNGFVSPLELTVSNLPLGMNAVYSDLDGNIIATFSGRLGGNAVTGDPIVTPVSDGVLPIIFSINAGSSTPTGTYSVFFGSQDPASGVSKAALAGVTVSVPDKPTITLSPLMAQPGTTINVLGSNFGSGEVTVKFGGLSSGTNGFVVSPAAVTTTGGTFSASFTVPAVSGGIYQIKATNLSGTASSTLEVLPLLSEGTVSMRIAPATLTVPAGSDGDITVTIVPIATFSSDVELAAISERGGLDGITFSPSGIITVRPGTPFAAGMHVSVSSTADVGTLIPVRVEAKAGGTTIATQRVYVRVADSGGDFFLSTTPKDLVAGRNTSVSSALTIITTGLTGSPVLSLEGLPAGWGEITDITPINPTGIATATIRVNVPSDADLTTLLFAARGGFAGHPEKQVSLSLSILEEVPTAIDSPDFDPTSIREDTPLHLTFPLGSSGGLDLTIYSLATNTYGTTSINYLLLPDAPVGSSVPSGLTLLMTGAGDVINMEPRNPFAVANYDLCITVPSPLPDGLTINDIRIAFLDTSQNPSAWTSIATAVSPDDPNLLCSAGVNHFSSWALLAINPAPLPQLNSGGHSLQYGSLINNLALTVPLSPPNHHTYEVKLGDSLSLQDKFPSTSRSSGTAKVMIQLFDEWKLDEGHSTAEMHQNSNVIMLGSWKIMAHLTSIDPVVRFLTPAAKVTVTIDITSTGGLDLVKDEKGKHLPTNTVAAPGDHGPSDDTHVTDHAQTSSGELMTIHYFVVDKTGKIVQEATEEFSIESKNDLHKKMYIFVDGDGTYDMKLMVTMPGTEHESAISMTVVANHMSIAAVVPWLTAYAFPLTQVALLTMVILGGIAVVSKRSTRSFGQEAERELKALDILLGRFFHKIKLSFRNVALAIAGLMVLSGFFIVFAGDRTSQENVGMWVTNATASMALLFSIFLIRQKGMGRHSRAEVALTLGIALWAGSRIVETWFNTVIPTLLPAEVLHHVYPGDFLLTFVTPHDVDVFNEVLDGNFWTIYGTFTALKMGGFSMLVIHLFEAYRIFAHKFTNKLVVAASIPPVLFLGVISFLYLGVLLGQIVIADFFIHIGYAVFNVLILIPSIVLLVALRKDTHTEPFWILSTLALLSFVIAYSWQAFIPVGPDAEGYLEWMEQNVWLSALLFGSDYLMLGFAILWEIRVHEKEKHAHNNVNQRPRNK